MRKGRYLQAIGVIIFAVIVSTVDWSDVWLLLSRMNIYWFISAIALVFLFLTVKAWRWRYLLKLQNINYGYLKAFYVYLSGVFLSLVTPGKVGDLIKIVYLKQDLGVPLGKGLSSALVDRLCDIVFSLLVGCLGILILAVPFELAMLFIACGAIILIILGIALDESTVNKLLTLALKIPLLSRFLSNNQETRLNDFYQGLRDLRNIRILIPLSASLLAYSLLLTNAYFLARALSIPVGFLNIAFCISITNLVALLPISVSGLGTRDGTMILLFSILGLAKESALTFSLMFLFVYSIPPTLVGLATWFKHPVDMKSFLAYPSS